MTTDEIIEVVTAFKNGKKIQSRFKYNTTSKWDNNANPHWDFLSRDYRVAREPNVIFVNEYSDGSFCGYDMRDKAFNKSHTTALRRGVKYIEAIIED